MKFKAPIPSDDYIKMIRWRIIKMTGWTLDYVDSLPFGKLYEMIQIEDGLTKANT